MPTKLDPAVAQNVHAKKEEVVVPGLEGQQVQTGAALQRAMADPRALSPRDVIRLQRAVGNQAVSHLLRRPGTGAAVQPKLTVGPAHDRYEQEADRVAAQVMSAPSISAPVAQRAEEDEEVQMMPLAGQISSLAQRAEEDEEVQMMPLGEVFSSLAQRAEEDEEVQTKPLVQRSGSGFEAGAAFESRLGAARGGGSALPDTTRSFMEERFGADFSGVRVHTDGQAHDLNHSIQAKAFTTGQDVFFRQGAYNPDSTDGKSLLAHELTHVVQQSGRGIRRKSSVKPALLNASGRLQRLWTVEEFKEKTYKGRLSGRSQPLKDIEALLKEYSELVPSSPNDIKTAKDMLLEILEHTLNWISDHTVDDGKEDTSNRMQGMLAFKNYIETVEQVHLNRLEDELGKNTETKDVPIAESRREGKLQAIRDSYQGSAKSMLNRVGFLLDTAVPNPGDKSKLDIEVKIPVDPQAVGFLGVHLVCQAERKKTTELNARMEMTVIGGAKIANILELKGELGGYFEAQAANSDQVMKIISYALYRRFVESKFLPAEIANYMWGGSTSVKGYAKAERWAANVEKEVFDKNSGAYVETGAIAAGSAGVDASAGGVGLKGKAALKGTMGTRYTAESIKKVKALGTTHTYKGRGDTQAKAGKSIYVIEPSLEFAVGMFKVSGKAKLTFGDHATKGRPTLTEWALEAAAQGSFPLDKNVLGGAPMVIAQQINGMVQHARAEGSAKSSNPGQTAGLMMGMAEDTTIAATQLAGLPQKDFVAFPDKSKPPDGSVNGKGEMAVKITLKYKRKVGDANGVWEINIDYIKGSEMGLKAIAGAASKATGVLTVKQEQSSRLLTLKYEHKADENGGNKGIWTVNPELN